jgi:hypothetical protein
VPIDHVHSPATTTTTEPAHLVPSSSPVADAPDPTPAPTSSTPTSPGVHGHRTRLCNNISKIKDFGKDIIRYDPAKRVFLAQVMAPDLSDLVPFTYTEALRSPHR